MFKYIKENHKIGLFFYGFLLVVGALVEMDGGSVGGWLEGALGILILATPWLLWIRSRMKKSNNQSEIKTSESGKENEPLAVSNSQKEDEFSAVLEWGMAKTFEQATVHKKTIEGLYKAHTDDELSMLETARINKELGPELKGGDTFYGGWHIGLGMLLWAVVMISIGILFESDGPGGVVDGVMGAIGNFIIFGMAGWPPLSGVGIMIFNRRYTHTIQLTVPEMVDAGDYVKVDEYKTGMDQFGRQTSQYQGSRKVYKEKWVESGNVVEKEFKVYEPRINKTMAYVVAWFASVFLFAIALYVK
jgi:hypothetical protein